MSTCTQIAQIACAIAIVTVGGATSVAAHDLWLQPQAFRVRQNDRVPTTVFVGHGSDRQRWGVERERVVRLRSIGPAGAIDHRPTLRPESLSQDFPIQLKEPGVHVLMMESAYAESTLPALRFNDYLKQEGLTPAIAARAKARAQNSPGSEVYSRRAKTLVKVGDASGPQPQVTLPVGMTLEIVPERNPFELKASERLPVQVLFEGKPLAGALIKMTNLDNDKVPVETALTDRSGRASFKGQTGGKWLLNVVWTKPLIGKAAEFDTTFSSLTFSFNQ